jgi:hypothetical protein
MSPALMYEPARHLRQPCCVRILWLLHVLWCAERQTHQLLECSAVIKFPSSLV